MTKEHIFTRAIPVRCQADVFVAGGGPAGIAAAWAAAKTGAKVFLAENEICFGGMATAGGLPMFCSFSDGVNIVADGVSREICRRLEEYDGINPCTSDCPERPGYHGAMYFNPEPLKRVYDELIVEHGIIFSLSTRIIGADCRDGLIDKVICCGKSGLFAVQAHSYVDATGDGDLAVWAGAQYEQGDAQGRLQPATLISWWAGIDWDKANANDMGLWNQNSFLRKAIEDGVFAIPDPGMPGIIPTGRSIGNGNLGHLFGADGTDEQSIGAAVIAGRRMLGDYQRYFREYLKGYENLELVGTSAMLGIRETRRIRGDYQLTVQDYWRRANFPDEIGRYCYGIDMHASSLRDEGAKKKDADDFRFEDHWLPEGESYGIPYRILLPVGVRNLWTAGRCVSVDREVLGSLRVMPGCFITGQAAGAAAALAAASKTTSREVPIQNLQQTLARLGAYVPNRAENAHESGRQKNERGERTEPGDQATADRAAAGISD